MSNQQQQSSHGVQPVLTERQKDTAKRLGMSEKEYFDATVAQIKRGKMQAKDIS